MANLGRYLLGLLIVLAVLASLAGGLDSALSLDRLRGSLAGLQEFRAQEPWAAAFAYFVSYLAVAALSIPGAAVFTLAGGAVFGFAEGLVLASFASSLGALLAFLASRYLLRDWVGRRLGARLASFQRGVASDGALYLFSLRLVPVVPFFVLNVLMGLTPIRAATYYWVSQVGMLAATALYVNAGTRLASISSPSEILSPSIGASLLALAAFPWLARLGLRWVERRRIYGRWRRPRRFDRNLVVIGAGAAGLVTSYIAAAVRARVTLVEQERMGGDCLNTGCVPSKSLIRAARLVSEIREAGRFGIQARLEEVDLRLVMQRVQGVIAAVAPHDSAERYTKLGVDVLQGRARLLDPWTVEIQTPGGETRQLRSRSIVIATGARPFVPSLPGIEQSGYVTSDTLWERLAQCERIPRRIVVMGGGPIGCELAQALARLGAQLTVVEMAPRLLLREDDEVSERVRARLATEGVEVLLSHRASACREEGANRVLQVSEPGGGERSIPYDLLVCAVGRVARLEGFGLEELGIETKRNIVTNEFLETTYPNILAAGDVAGPYQFTHAAGHQAWYAAVNALFGDFKRFRVDYRALPWTTFTDPEVARVGLNERDAREQGVAFEVTRFELSELDRAIAEGATEGFVKVLTVLGRDRILGVTIVGAHAGDILAEFALAMRWGMGLNKVLGTVHSYPTFAEANKYAAGAWKRAHAPEWILRQLARWHAWRRGDGT